MITSPRLTPIRTGSLVLRQVDGAPGHGALDLHGAADGVHDARELDQRAVAHQLDDAAVVLGDRRIHELGAQTPETASVPSSSAAIRRE